MTRAVRSLALLPLLLPWFWSCTAPAKVFIDTPTHGSFVIGTSVNVTGRMQTWDNFVAASVNGIPVPFGPTFAVNVPLDPAAGCPDSQPVGGHLLRHPGFVRWIGQDGATHRVSAGGSGDRCGDRGP